MVKQVSIIWRTVARDKINQSLQWCLNQFGEKIAGKFYQRLKKESNYLSSAPYIGHVELLLSGKSRSYRSLSIKPHFKLIYYINEEKAELHIVDFWDTRRSPEHLKDYFPEPE